MNEKLNILKALFDEFLQESRTVYQSDRNNQLTLNASVFEFQAHVTSSLKESKMNLALNPDIHSTSIQQSFDRKSEALSAHDYCLSFFDFLNIHKARKLELFELIDLFIDQHKEELTWQDIVITATGATRCRTNLRFALNNLRKIGLIRDVDNGGKRAYVPTLKGELVFFAWRARLNNGRFDESIFSRRSGHDVTIRSNDFSKLYFLLRDVSAHRNKYFAEFKEHNRTPHADDEVVNILKDLDRFLKEAIITEHGIFIREKKK